MQRAAEYAERAKEALPDFGDSEIHALLGELADFSAKRPF